MKIGVLSGCFRTGLIKGFDLAVENNISGIQVHANQLTEEGLEGLTLEDVKQAIKDRNLEISALCGVLRPGPFEDIKENEVVFAKAKELIDMARILETNVVTTHIGVIPEDKNCQKFKIMLDAFTRIGEYAKQFGITIAIETGPEKATTLKQFLDCTNGGMGVNLDPANFVMVTNQDPVEAVHILGDYIVHTHAKDGKKLLPCDAMDIYGGRLKGIKWTDYFKEMPLGEGRVPFDEYVQALRDIGYDSYLTIEREVGENPIQDIQKAVKFLTKYI